MAEIIHEFEMEMTCEGCVAAAKKVLGKLPEVSNVDASHETKRVIVTSTLPKEKLLEQLQKTGKTITYIGTK